MRCRLAQAVIVFAVISLPLSAADRLQDRRTSSQSSTARTAPASNTTRASPNALVDILQQLDLLQNEIKDMRNLVEIQANEIDRLQSRQRDLLRDLDHRVGQLERGQGPVSDSVQPGNNPKALSAGRAADSEKVQKDYNAAFALMKKGEYAPAVKRFRQFLKRHPDSGLRGNAQYWIAEANYVEGNYPKALKEFKKVISDYPKSAKVVDAKLKIGYTYYELKQWKQARSQLNSLLKKYPKSRAAKGARNRLAVMKRAGH